MVDLAAFLGSLIWNDWGGHPEEASQARELGAVLAKGLTSAGYRVVKQEQVTRWLPVAERDEGLVERPAMTDQPKLETCRACLDEQRDKGDWGPAPAADFILWGKLFPPEHLGPRCYDHTAAALGQSAMPRIEQYAVFDLRGLVRP